MSDFLAAALQLTSTSDIDANLNAAEEQIELASRRGADLVGLPENFAFLGEDQKKLKIASSVYEKCNSFFQTLNPLNYFRIKFSHSYRSPSSCLLYTSPSPRDS